MQREHFFKRCVYFTPNGAHYVPDPKPVLQKPGNFSRLSSVGLKMADGQASFDHESERPSARCWGWGKGRLGTGLLFLPKNRSGSGEVVSAGTFLI